MALPGLFCLPFYKQMIQLLFLRSKYAVIIKFYAETWLEVFSKSGLKTIRDIWDMDGMDFMDESVVLNKLGDTRNGFKHYRLIKSSINKGWVNA